MSIRSADIYQAAYLELWRVTWIPRRATTPTTGAAKATKVILVQTPRASTPPRRPMLRRWSVVGRLLVLFCARANATASRTVSSEFEKGRRRNVNAIGELAKRITEADDVERAQME